MKSPLRNVASAVSSPSVTPGFQFRFRFGPLFQRASLLVLGGALTAAAAPGGVEGDRPGLAVAFTHESTQESAHSVASGVALYVESGGTPTPFLAGGRFKAVWAGALNAELRSEYFFQAELRGSVKIEINDAVVLETASDGGSSPLSTAVKLNKGPNPFKATFLAPATGDAFLRLGWTEKGPHTSPIPSSAFTHASTPALDEAMRVRRGRELFLSQRCIHCHTGKKQPDAEAFELRMDAPSLEGIGSRRHYGWMVQWILDPKSFRPASPMPALLRGPDARKEAEAIAAYLASLKTGGERPLPKGGYTTKQAVPAEPDGAVAPGGPRSLYERLHCVGCHQPPDSNEPAPDKIPQRHVAEKFPAGKLAEFLRAPEAHYAWTRMPNFHLSAQEAQELEEWLFAAAGKPQLVPAPSDPALIERGRKLVQTAGCLNCHELPMENQFKAPVLDTLASRHRKDRAKAPAGDCLGPTPYAAYALSSDDRAALDAFTAKGLPSLQRHAPAEFAERQTRLLNCTSCHGQLDQIPAFEVLGAKLRPEWAAKFIGGAFSHKFRYDAHPRGEPWVEARMPAFKSRAQALAAGLAALNGYPPTTPPEPPIDMELARIGHQLVGKEGGFSCVSCHGVGSLPALEVFESEGINLAYSGERLLPAYFRRWMRSPLSIDPQTKMPTYFDEGKSPLTDVLDGDAEKQITALWHYLRLGEKMPVPKTGEQ